MGKLDTLVGRKGRIMTKRGFMYWYNRDEVNEVIRIDKLEVPTIKGFKTKTVVVIRDSQGAEHDVAPSVIKDITPVN